MGIKKFRPVTQTLRYTTISDFAEITKSKPEKALLRPLKKMSGRNSYGRITMRGRGGGHKRMYRMIDFKRDRFDVEALVIAIEYDPNRSSRIALIEYTDKVKSYIIAPLEINVGDKVSSSIENDIEIKPGNCMPLGKVPLGTAVHNIELRPGQGGQICRSAGTAAQIMAKEGDYAFVRMPSSEVRKIHIKCRATIGQIGNEQHEALVIGKAGRMRWSGRRGISRGVVQNPVDHPHGGGEGKAPQGNPHPVSPWGKPTKGYKTRKKKKYSNSLIIRDRKRGKKKGA